MLSAVEAFLNCFGENYVEAHPFRPKLHLRSERGDESNEDRLIIFRGSASNLDDSVGTDSNSRFRAGGSLDCDRVVPERYKGRNKFLPNTLSSVWSLDSIKLREDKAPVEFCNALKNTL
jgi:hypothetical protein